MPDITMCKDEKCPLKSSCYRFNANPSMYQSYFMGDIWNEEKQNCDHYWEEPYKVTEEQKKIISKMK